LKMHNTALVRTVRRLFVRVQDYLLPHNLAVILPAQQRISVMLAIHTHLIEKRSHGWSNTIDQIKHGSRYRRWRL
jgi:hypothetical protein